MKVIRLALIGSLFLILAACGGDTADTAFSTAAAADPPQYGTPFDGVPDTRDINLYQVNIRAFSQDSDLDGVTARLDEIADVGTNVIYLMPIFPVGEDDRSKVSTSTSPYSIKDFTGVGSEFGTLEDLRELVDGAHERGMAVILDFVVNQTSWDHPWITEHPDWYLQEGGVIQPLNPFPDVAALDLNNQEMRAALIEALRYWVFAANIDGYRMDYANNPSLEFWEQINGDLRSIDTHDLILFAEGDRLTNFDVGFDINFGDKWYYDAIRPISQGGSVSAIENTTNIEYTNADETQQVTRYTGNHDTSGDGTPLEVFGGQDGVMANFVVSAYMRGVPFLYGGQEVAFAQRIPFPWDSVKIDWSQNADVTAEFKKVLDFRTASTAIRRGDLNNLSNDNVVAFTKTSTDEKVVVFSNLRSNQSSYQIPTEMAGTYSDAYTGASVTLTAGETLSLAGFEYQALTSGDVTPPTDPVDPPTDPVDPPTDPVDPPTDPVDPPTDPVDPPTDPVDPPTDPVDPPTDPVDPDGVYRIKNRWLDAYLYDGGDEAQYGDVNDSSAEWESFAVDGFVAFRNVATGDFLSIETEQDFAEAAGGDATFWSAQWALEDYDGFQRLRNRWRGDRYLDTERQLGYAQATGGLFAGSYSTHWVLEPVSR